MRNNLVETLGCSLSFPNANSEALFGRRLVTLFFLKTAAFKCPLFLKRLLDFVRGFENFRFPRFEITFSDSFLDDLDALLTASSLVLQIRRISSTEYFKWLCLLAIYSDSGADKARSINARSRFSGSASAPNRLSMPSLFVRVVIRSRTVPFP